MTAKKLPYTDEDRIQALKHIIAQEESLDNEHSILSFQDLYEMRNFVLTYEGSFACHKQALDDELKASTVYLEHFKTAQLYILHFIQVLNLAIIRNEIKQEHLNFYEMSEPLDRVMPDLSTEDAVLEWGDRLIKGEAERTLHGGTPIYNPAISKVKVHLDLFKEALYSLMIFRQNTLRSQEIIKKMQERADRSIWDTWTRVESKYWKLPEAERKQKLADYGVRFFYKAGEQLHVFG